MADTVRVEERRNVSVAFIAARRGVEPNMIGGAIGVTLPGPRVWTDDEGTIVMASGPGRWLAQRQDAPPAWERSLEQRLAGIASVSDQTGAYRIFRVEGPRASTLLQRGVSIDLIGAAFPGGLVAVTSIAHIDVVVRCLEAGQAYEVSVFRSFAENFLRWLDSAVAGILHETP